LVCCACSLIQTLINNLKEIKGLITVHPECKVTFLEIPIFSIYLWNKCMNHPEINQFKEEDYTVPSHTYSDILSKYPILVSKLSRNQARPCVEFCPGLNHHFILFSIELMQ
jgi:hypothetical protein